MYAKESDLQVQVCNLLDLILPDNSVYHHSPNESQGNKPQFYKKLKRMGFKPGWCDLEIITPDKPAIFIELKRPGNYATISQKQVHTMLKDLFQMRKNKKQNKYSWYQNNKQKGKRKKKELSLS